MDNSEFIKELNHKLNGKISSGKISIFENKGLNEITISWKGVDKEKNEEIYCSYKFSLDEIITLPRFEIETYILDLFFTAYEDFLERRKTNAIPMVVPKL